MPEEAPVITAVPGMVAMDLAQIVVDQLSVGQWRPTGCGNLRLTSPASKGRTKRLDDQVVPGVEVLVKATNGEAHVLHEIGNTYRKECFERKGFFMRRLQLVAHGEPSDVIELNTVSEPALGQEDVINPVTAYLWASTVS
jgi:hypothetical protein